MVNFNPLLKKAYWSLAGLGVIYFGFLFALTVPSIQKNFVYLHRVRLPLVLELDKPEQFGFAKNQVTPFILSSGDEKLFAWHILPNGIYADNRDKLINEPTGVQDPSKALSFELLRSNPDAKVVIFFHGNAGTVGQGWRPDAYRNFISVDPNRVHVFAFDYRGFGRSTGEPTEDGLIADGAAMLRFIINDLDISPSRIVVVGQSLGTAIVLGATDVLAREDKTEFAGVVLLAGFSNMKVLIMTYSIAGIVPILGPLRQYPWLQRKLQNFVNEQWNSLDRVKSLVKHSPHLRLSIVHSYDDIEIIWHHSEYLYQAAANAVVLESKAPLGGDTAEVKELSPGEVDKLSKRKDLDGEGWENTWMEGVPEGGWSIEQKIIKWGGHNQIVTASTVGLVIRKRLGL